MGEVNPGSIRSGEELMGNDWRLEALEEAEKAFCHRIRV